MNCHMKPCGPKYIPIFRGDDTDFQGNRKIVVVIDTHEDLTGFTVHFVCMGIDKDFGPVPESKELEIVFSEEETKEFKLGFWDATIYLRDPNGKKKTIDNRIGLHVTNSPSEAYCQDSDRRVCIHVERPAFGRGRLPVKALPKYLHELSFDDTYPADAEKWYESIATFGGSCSAVVRDGKLYRNYDWTFDHTAEFVVRVSAVGDRHASVGVASLGPALTEGEAADGVYTNKFRALPGMTLDGINDAGVVAEINVDGGPKDGWHGTGENSIHILGAVRWVLDHGESAEQAAEYIASHVRQPSTMNFHFIVADAEKTFIVENGVAHDVTDGTKVLTNYALYDEGHEGGGKERYELLAGGADISATWWTNAYKPGNDWDSDFDSVEQHQSAIEQWAAQGSTKEIHRGRKTAGGSPWWQSVHTSEYDFATKTMKVSVQESGEYFTFAIMETGGGGGEGTTDYNRLRNKPKINDVELVGNKSLESLGIQEKLPKDGDTYDILVSSAAKAESAETANRAEYATNDDDGNTITETYAKISDTYNKSEVDDKITRFVAHYLTDKVNGRFVPFATHAALAAAKAAHTEQNPRFFYAGQPFTPTKNDYCVVLADETYEGKTTRYSYVGDWPTGSFQYQYTINDTAFSQAQWDAINSGITSELIEQFEEALEEKQDKLAVGGDGTYQIQVNRALEAEEAIKDGDGRVIKDTYAEKLADTVVGKIDEERHEDSISAKVIRVPIEFSRTPFNAVKVSFHEVSYEEGDEMYLGVGYSSGTGGSSGINYTDTILSFSHRHFSEIAPGPHVYVFEEDFLDRIPQDAKFLTFFFATSDDIEEPSLIAAPIETGYATDEEVAQKKYQIQETDGFFHLEHAPLFDFLIVDDEVARKSNVASVADKVTEISATVSTNNRFLVNDTTAAIQTREDEDAEFSDEIHVDKGYDALQGDVMVNLDKSVQTVTMNGGTLEVVFPEGVDGTVRDLCLYVNNTNSTTECEMTFPAGTYYGADGWDAAAQKGGITGYYFSEIPGNGWRVSREELEQFTKGA